MLLIETSDRGFINLDKAEEFHFRRNSDKNVVIVITFPGERLVSAQISKAEYERFQNEIRFVEKVHFIASPPGYSVVTYSRDEEVLDRWPVLAWILDPEFGYHKPITAWQEKLDDDDIIVCPNGRAVRPGSQAFDSEEAWLEDRRKNAAANKMEG